MSLVTRQFRGLFVGLFGAFALFGTSMTLVGAALPRILGDFGWTYAAAGAVIAASAVTYFLSSFLSGRILKKIGPKATILIGLASCVVGLAFFAATPSFLLNLLLNALIGAGQGLIEPTVNLAALRMDEKSTGRPMNLMHGAFAIGAVGRSDRTRPHHVHGPVPWTLLFRAIAVLFADPRRTALALMPFSRLGRAKEERAPGAADADLRKNPAYWLGFACLLLYVGAELGISNWIAEYFVRIFAAAPAFASLTVSLFWIGLLAGRFGVPALYRGSRPEAVLVASSLLLIASTIALCALGFAAVPAQAAAREGAVTQLFAPAALTFFAGLGCSIIYPTVVSLVGISCKEAQAEAISFAIAGGGVGLFAFPFIMSWISQAYGIRIGFASYAIIAALTAAACLALARVFAKTRKNKA
jgi:FHS family L-fucose permease-like MFS transporter